MSRTRQWDKFRKWMTCKFHDVDSDGACSHEEPDRADQLRLKRPMH
jgi:hypothetical protein